MSLRDTTSSNDNLKRFVDFAGRKGGGRRHRG